MPLQNFTRAQIIEALKLLSFYAAEEGVVLEMSIYGGSVMLLAYDSRAVTKDVDAVVRPEAVAQKLAKRVAKAMSIHENWLSTDVKMFLSQQESKNDFKIEGINEKHLKLTKPTASYLLAMKCLACRQPLPGYQGDIEDIRFLVQKMNIKSLEEVDRYVGKFFDESPLTPKARAVIEEIINSSTHS